jgi:hypothetical protein
VIASGNHLLTQVKDNQPTLRRKLELGAIGRKPSGYATSKAKGRNRWESRELTVFPVKAWFRHSPWEKLIKIVLRLERTVCKRNPKTGLCVTTTETVFWVSSAEGVAPERWNEWIRGHCASRMAATTCATSLSAKTLPASERTPTSLPACVPSPTT